MAERDRLAGVARKTARLLAALLSAWVLLGAAPPGESWLTIETPHFRIHYLERLQTFAERVAVLAEEVHDQLAPIYGDTASYPVNVVIVDDFDTANGSANIVPYDLIRLYAMAPEADGNLGDSDDWLRMLILHEYVHILHLDTISGPARIWNAVFGKSFGPNQALPRWITEGLATFEESALTEGGRLRNNLFRMYLRMDAYTNRFRDSGGVTGAPVRFPGANVWYLYGSDFVDYVARTRGREAWISFIREIGGTALPTALNVYARRSLGDDIVSLWDEYAAAAQGEFAAEGVAVIARGLTPTPALTDAGNTTGAPRCLGPDHLAFFRDDGEQTRAVAAVALPGRNAAAPDEADDDEAEASVLLEVDGDGTYDVSRDGRFVVVSLLSDTEHLYGFFDLYRYDLAAGGLPTRLTRGERAREPALSPDGTRVAYIAVNRVGGADLRELDLRTGETRVLHNASDLSLAATPDYSPDGRYVVFSLWRLDWGRDIALVDTRDGSLRLLTDDRAQDLTPAFSPDGASVLFASDRTAIFNAYELDLGSGDVVQRSNVLGGVLAPRRCSPGGPLVVRRFGPDGFDIAWLDGEGERAAPAPYERPEVAYPDHELEAVRLDQGRYEPWRYLYPRAWSPTISQEGSELLLGATVVGGDPVGHHAYTAAVTYNAETQRPSVGIGYAFSALRANLSAYLSYAERERDGLFAESAFQRFAVDRVNAGVGVGIPFFDVGSGHSLRLSYDFRSEALAAPLVIEHDPADLEPSVPDLGRSDELGLAWNWGDADGFAYTVSTSEGTELNVTLSLRSPVESEAFDVVQLTWGLRHYQPAPWFHEHVFALLVTGGISRGPNGRRGNFGVGGPPEQDVLLSIIEDTPAGAGFLRGYERFAQTGRQYHLLNLEYRMPLFTIDQGPWTLPFFLRRLYAAVFVDYGTATDDLDGFGGWLTSVGAELRLQTTLAYGVPGGFRLGWAYGFGRDATNQVYVLYGGTF